jgi:hypothetical protein
MKYVLKLSALLGLMLILANCGGIPGTTSPEGVANMGRQMLHQPLPPPAARSTALAAPVNYCKLGNDPQAAAWHVYRTYGPNRDFQMGSRDAEARWAAEDAALKALACRYQEEGRECTGKDEYIATAYYPGESTVQCLKLDAGEGHALARPHFRFDPDNGGLWDRRVIVRLPPPVVKNMAVNGEIVPVIGPPPDDSCAGTLVRVKAGDGTFTWACQYTQ